jgi:hypothetical protein
MLADIKNSQSSLNVTNLTPQSRYNSPRAAYQTAESPAPLGFAAAERRDNSDNDGTSTKERKNGTKYGVGSTYPIGVRSDYRRLRAFLSGVRAGLYNP